MTPFTEVLLVFGTTRDKEKFEGLDKDEVNFINSLELKDRAMRFVNEYCKRYNVECISMAEHNDEKTKHYQIVFTNYDFTKQACHRRDKKQMRVYGSSLQYMAANAFSGIAIRGIKGGVATHKDLARIHQTQRI
ncbi:hypothetical protein U5B43_07380 [Campylobacter sp. 9BO]|uniref:hypothetical protein n=1 Tax=Campylobacter sp. 9BO TaxID=3424759 RepID=UPI003D34B984